MNAALAADRMVTYPVGGPTWEVGIELFPTPADGIDV
jgi:hypothetical protein